MGDFKRKLLVIVLVLVGVQILGIGFALNDEGRVLLRFREGIEVDPFGYLLNWRENEDIDPCEWNGVACEGARVVSLNLENLCLKGILSPDVGKLLHLRYLLLRNNSFYGIIPNEIGQLQNLEVLDLGYNDFSGSFPFNLINVSLLQAFSMEGNRFLLQDAGQGFSFNDCGWTCIDSDPSFARSCSSRETAIRRLEGEVLPRDPGYEEGDVTLAPGSAPEKIPYPPPPSNHEPPPDRAPAYPRPVVPQVPSTSANQPRFPPLNASQKKTKYTLVYGLAGGGASLVIFAFIIFIVFHIRKVSVRPWAPPGLSAQLRKAFVTGLPKLLRSELETACEGFSNIIGAFQDSTVYKGMLSNGVEIAVSSIKTNEWSEQSQRKFRKKIETLSKVNHKNFVNLIGYCEDEQPFSRMLIFEYAPNGKLFEHLHNMESHDYLNWAARMRITVGVAYCLNHMLRLNPPIIIRKLDSRFVQLTDDFAAKVADMELHSDTGELERIEPGCSLGTEAVVHLFGMLLLEIITGRPMYSDENGGLSIWASDYLHGRKPAKEAIDPALDPVRDGEFGSVFDVVKQCLHTDPAQRPSMEAVVQRLKEITSIAPEGAAPRLSPLWWAELEIISRDPS